MIQARGTKADYLTFKWRDYGRNMGIVGEGERGAARMPLQVFWGGPTGKEVLTLGTFSVATCIGGKQTVITQP